MRFGESDGEMVIERWNQAFQALSAEPRRQLIVALNDIPAEGQVHLPEAAMSPTAPPDQERITFQLQHRHLPLLEERGYIQWTADPFRARRGSHFEDVAIVFDALQEMASQIPDRLVHGCQRLENEREENDHQ